MLREIGWVQFVEWQVYAGLEPFGDERADWRQAADTAVAVNLQRDHKKRPRPYEPRDFVLRFESEARAVPRRRSREEVNSMMNRIFDRYVSEATQESRKRAQARARIPGPRKVPPRGS